MLFPVTHFLFSGALIGKKTKTEVFNCLCRNSTAIKERLNGHWVFGACSVFQLKINYKYAEKR